MGHLSKHGWWEAADHPEHVGWWRTLIGPSLARTAVSFSLAAPLQGNPEATISKLLGALTTVSPAVGLWMGTVDGHLMREDTPPWLGLIPDPKNQGSWGRSASALKAWSSLPHRETPENRKVDEKFSLSGTAGLRAGRGQGTYPRSSLPQGGHKRQRRPTSGHSVTLQPPHHSHCKGKTTE